MVKRLMRPFYKMSFSKLMVIGILVLATLTILSVKTKASLQLDESNEYIRNIDHWSEEIPFSMIEDCVSAGVDDAFDALTFKSFNPIEKIKGIVGALGVVARAMIVFFCISDLMDKLSRQILDIEEFIRTAIKFLAVGALVTTCCYPLLEGIYNVSVQLVSGVAQQQATNPMVTSVMYDIAEYLTQSEVLGCVCLIFVIFLPWVCSKFLVIFIIATCYSRLFAIGLYGAFAPIGLAPMVQEGFSGHGMRYLKKFMAVCFQGAIIAFAITFGEMIRAQAMIEFFNASQGDGFTYWASMVFHFLVSSVIVTIAEVVTLGKTQQVANDMLGA